MTSKIKLNKKLFKLLPVKSGLKFLNLQWCGKLESACQQTNLWHKSSMGRGKCQATEERDANDVIY